MSEATGLSIVIEAKNALAVFTQPDHIESILQQVEKEVNSFVPDVSTKKGRDAIASLGLKVAKTKTYLDGLGKDLVTEYKEVPKKIDASRKTVRDRLDALKEKVLLPKLEFEAEQERLKLEAERIAAEEAYSAMWQEAHDIDAVITIRIAEKAAAKKESDHEMALLMNDAFDRDAKAKADEVERLRKAHEEFIAQQAVEKAKREAEIAAQQEREAAARREAELKLQAELAERDRLGAIKQAEEDKRLAEIRRQNEINEAEDRKAAALVQAEREKQEAIAAEQLKARQEAERVQREAKQKEDARLAEEKRVADEAAKRAADVEHRRTINRQAVAELIANGLPEDCAQKCVAAIAKNLISSVRITY
ncbi:cell envelope biogenesis protein TolA [Yersinia mollaretii]|uniref:cell envelope biogenesis protein TolA n=1 Tax=Yersinia mollaretii TaxID=33060 RepID=UPI000C155944|nr:cell envelope biogenesis protein TolA [Yersinia mollaretii]MDA5529055.1 cell envelope biogenesis protein TolA [Yersinia mollaretii]MDR7875782.1 cell envelope biogenesis protein TolA [Yersinia mollaretii]PHZ29604.1 cell envelope biogenesis protein TolA [Yersinia mollaretii]WQC73798.1 cell envelope biogenesis protein TolA [Yersinia mollaretii]